MVWYFVCLFFLTAEWSLNVDNFEQQNWRILELPKILIRGKKPLDNRNLKKKLCTPLL